jgi:hypothetical protein
MSGWRHELTITFQSGERLKVAPFSLTDYLKFAKLVGEGYKEGALAPTGIQAAIPLASAGRWATLTFNAGKSTPSIRRRRRGAAAVSTR